MGTLVKDIKQEILLITEPGREDEVITRLARVGYDNAIGYLNGGIDAWIQAGKEIDILPTVTVDEFAAAEVADASIQILDVRKKVNTIQNIL